MAIDKVHHATPSPRVAGPAISPPTKFVLPDLVSHCQYPLLVNKHCNTVAALSSEWLLAGAEHNEKTAKKFMGLKAGELTAACYPDADADALRVCADFLNWLFNMDDWSDEFDVETEMGMRACVMAAMTDPHNYKTDKAAARLAQSFCTRMIDRAGPRCYARFLRTMDEYYAACERQTEDREKGIIPDLEGYIAMREDTSGCKPSFVMHEYAADLDLPLEVTEHPVFLALEEAANALVTWSNDIFSYDVEQSRHDTHNMIAVLMEHRHYTLQQAVDFVGDLCKQCIDRFEAARQQLPSWGEQVDDDVLKYVMGLQHWIVGSLHWSFETERYFGKNGLYIKKTRIVHLSPKRPLPSQPIPVPAGTIAAETQKDTNTTMAYMRLNPLRSIALSA